MSTTRQAPQTTLPQYSPSAGQQGSTIAQSAGFSITEGPSGTITHAIITAGSQALTASQGQDPFTAVVDGTTLVVGGPPATISGQVVSAVPNGVVATPAPAPATTTQEAVFSAGGQPITAYAPSGASTAVVGSTTISVGGPPATIGGQTISLGPSGIVIASNGQAQTVTFVPPAVTTTKSTSVSVRVVVRAIFVVGGNTYTAYEQAGGKTAVVNGTVISVGGSPVTISGQTISLAPTGILVATQGQTSTLTFLKPASTPASTTLSTPPPAMSSPAVGGMTSSASAPSTPSNSGMISSMASSGPDSSRQAPASSQMSSLPQSNAGTSSRASSASPAGQSTSSQAVSSPSTTTRSSTSRPPPVYSTPSVQPSSISAPPSLPEATPEPDEPDQEEDDTSTYSSGYTPSSRPSSTLSPFLSTYVTGGTTVFTVLAGRTVTQTSDGQAHETITGGITTSFTTGGITVVSEVATKVTPDPGEPTPNQAVLRAEIGPCPGADGLMYEPPEGGSSLLVSCGLVYRGHILSAVSRRSLSRLLRRATSEDCQAECEQMPDCVGFTNTDGACYFFVSIFIGKLLGIDADSF